MKLQITTDLSKIVIKFKVQITEITNYRVICVLLNEDNKICSPECIIDKCNLVAPDSSILLTIDSDNENIFHVNLEKVSTNVKYITFLLIGDPTGSTIKNVRLVKAILIDLDKDTDVATLKMPVFDETSKCVSICTFINNKDSWVFREVCKTISLDDINLSL